MYMGKLIRYFCVVGPRAPKAEQWWPDIAHDYAKMFAESGVGVRILPIGGSPFAARGYEHWNDLAEHFVGELDPLNYVNIVCAPPAFPTGRRVSARAFAPTRVVGARGGEVSRAALAEGRKATDEVVYDPELALIALWTAGHSNVAITGTFPEPPGEEEREALRRYDLVIAPTRTDAVHLAALKVPAVHYTAEELAIGRSPCLPF